MRQYAREIVLLLRGCGGPLASAVALCTASALLDMACMVLLPAFLFMSLTGSLAAGPYLPFAGAIEGWTPNYASLTGVVVAIFVLRGAVSLFVAGRLTRLSETIRATLTQKLASYYLTCSFQDFTRRSVAWAQTTIGAYTATFAGSVALPLLRLLLDFLTMAAILGFLMLVDHRVVGLVTMTLATVGIAYYLSVRRAAAQQSKRLSEVQADFGHQLSRALHAPREVRVFQLQEPMLAEVQRVLAQGADAQARLTMIGSLPRVLGELTLIGLAVSYLAYRSRGGTDPALMMSQLGLLAFAGLRLLPAFALSLGNIAALRAGRHATGLLARELESAGDGTRVPAHAAGPAEPFESLELREVSFAYATSEKPVLERVSLTIRRGDSVGVVGGSGAGKSTLGDLLLGLLVPTSGEILVNGKSARLDGDAWWRVVGFVPQAVFLANETLLHNIAFGVPRDRIDRARAQRAASLAQLDKVISELPRGLDGTIGDYGVRLSGGQRQRVAIARALYHDRQFLVLDEATSALDAETERAIVQAVASLRGNVTTFIIAHRHSTLAECDVILEVQEGRVTPKTQRDGIAAANPA